jgi:hypothetical protein
VAGVLPDSEVTCTVSSPENSTVPSALRTALSTMTNACGLVSKGTLSVVFAVPESGSIATSARTTVS